MSLQSYLPQDRLQALARGETLPDRAEGTILFADISGFTLLTETLRRTLGPRLGAEALTHHLDTVYNALIGEIERFGGSIIGFAGDAVTCWFDETTGPAARRAAAGAFALQRAMTRFSRVPLPDGSAAHLGLKVTAASGSTRRFVVGNPAYGLLDTLAGAPVARCAVADRLAKSGEVLLDETTVQRLDSGLAVSGWRTDEASGERFAVVEAYRATVEVVRPPDLPVFQAEILQPWIQPAVFARVQAGLGDFLTAFRPCVALFIRFAGINYQADSAEAELNAFISRLQAVAGHYEGTLIDLNIGDKGSYAYINFGAFNAHEDDARRAVKTALALRAGSPLSVQMGITQGLMRAGAYGGRTRRAYSALGNDVNLAARLMQAARPGEILISRRVHKAVQREFSWETRPLLTVKGLHEPLPVFALMGSGPLPTIHLQEPTYSLPMVGRQSELKTIEERLDLALQARGQVIGIIAEAGLGKSRLAAEVIHSARQKGFVGYGGTCQSDGINTPYLAWKTIWQPFFGVESDRSLPEQMEHLAGQIASYAPARQEALPLLGTLLDLSIPDNEFTRSVEPQIRQSALHALLEDCLRAAAQEAPILIMIDDLHWIDAISHDLLEELAKALSDQPVCFVLAYRPPELLRLQTPRLEALPQFTRVDLAEFSPAEAMQAIRAKLAQLYPEQSAEAVPEELVKQLMVRAQGNPFYLEELLNYLRDRGLDPHDPAVLEQIELPNSLHRLILSRIDQLSEHEKTTLRVASIVGRLFRARWLMGYYPELGPRPQVKAALNALDTLDITPLDTPEPELAYIFKHIVTHEVTYESLPFATRARLHERLAQFLEKQIAAGVLHESLLLETLAFHYGHSDNVEKQRLYWRKAGNAAQKNFANATALDHYGRLLAKLDDGADKMTTYLQRGSVWQLMGQYEEAEADFRAALALVEQGTAAAARTKFALGKLCRLRGDYEAAQGWLIQAEEEYTLLGERQGIAQALTEMGMVLHRKGDYGEARERLDLGLDLARAAGDEAGMAQAFYTLGAVTNNQGDYAASEKMLAESLALRRKLGDRQGIAMALNSMGIVASNRGNYDAAWALCEESLSLRREMGDRQGIANSLSTLGLAAFSRGDFSKARVFMEESLTRQREMGEKWGITASLGNLGILARAQGDYPAARAFFEASMALGNEIDDKTSVAYALLGLGLVGLAEESTDARDYLLQSLHMRRDMGEQLGLASNLSGIAGYTLQQGRPRLAARLLGAAETALKRLNARVDIDVQYFHAQTVSSVRSALGDAAFQAAWDEGSAWSLEAAVSMAIDETGSEIATGE